MYSPSLEILLRRHFRCRIEGPSGTSGPLVEFDWAGQSKVPITGFTMCPRHHTSRAIATHCIVSVYSSPVGEHIIGRHLNAQPFPSAHVT